MDGNRLAQETSPYLLQHKDNPVHWWAWGAEALAEAKRTGKPILLSIGYSACHWCHVMAHESFETPAIAELMNQRFVNIKVDREERPDLDAIYQHALAMMGQQGGWPLTMFLTPEAEPFWGGTYFPPTSRYGRPGLPEVLKAVAQTWADEPAKVRQNVEALRDGLRDQTRSPGGMALDLTLLDHGARTVLPLIDRENGGLSGAPKFPQPGLFQFLWRAALRSGDGELRDAATLTLDHMCQGGIYDHLGGGFMRYSTDDHWLVPHFEKMLYDNAQLIELLTAVWKGTGEPLYRQRVAETVEWLLREMTAEGGAFASALDADSEGGEGRFYTWTLDEIGAALDTDSARWVAETYDVRAGGNWEGRTILHRNHPLQPKGVDEQLADARAVLWREREARPRPGRDDKILADWNGMTIAALAGAAFTFDMPCWLDAARCAFATICRDMSLPGDRLGHSMRFGRVGLVGLLEDYAQMARAALVLYEVTGDGDLLDQARRWVAAADHHYWDAAEGGYFQTADDAHDVIVRTKSAWDGAVPSGNGVMAEVHARLWLATGEDFHRERADATIAAFSAAAPDQFANMTSLLGAFEMLAAPTQVVVVGPADSDATQSLLRAVAQAPTPALSLARSDGPVVDGSLPSQHPAHGKGMIGADPTAYVCHASTCSPPITDAAGLRKALAARYS